ncbi:MAG: hypothetical protein ACJ8C4_03145 [Gemmataceae bacterium]
MSMEWTAAVHSAGLVAFTKNESANFRADVQKRLSARSLPSNLRHADEQSVAGLGAILDAIDRSHLELNEFENWGVVAAPRSPGRDAMISSLTRYRNDGAWGVSPQLIPHYSLHSLSGLASVTFRFTGPNIGTGGTTGRESDAILAAASFINDGHVRGVWLVMTGWEFEETPNAICRAVALALAPNGASSTPQLSLSFSATGSATSQFSLESLHEVLSAAVPGPDRHWSLPGDGRLTWRIPEEAPVEVAA